MLTIAQAKEHEIFDTTPFMKSRLFSTNGYILADGIIPEEFNKSQ